MKCDEFKEMTVDYADGGLDAVSRSGMEAHAKVCPSCRAELDATLDMFSSLKGGALADPGELFWRNFNKEVYSQLKPAAARTFIKFARRRTGAGVAAAAMLLISISGFLSMERNISQLPGPDNLAASRSVIAEEEYDIMNASLSNSAEIPNFNSLNTGEREAAANGPVEKADERADAILTDRSYNTSAPNEYTIPHDVQELTDDEARTILDAMPAADGGGEI